MMGDGQEDAGGGGGGEGTSSGGGGSGGGEEKGTVDLLPTTSAAPSTSGGGGEVGGVGEGGGCAAEHRLQELERLFLAGPGDADTHSFSVETLLDVLLVLFDECTNSSLRREKTVSDFIEFGEYTHSVHLVQGGRGSCAVYVCVFVGLWWGVGYSLTT